MGPDYCASCVKTSAACSTGRKGAGGRLCPQTENAVVTAEGFRIWEAVRAPGVWTHTGFGPARLDRQELARRLGDRVPAWLLDELLDDYERAAHAAMATAKRKPSPDQEGFDDGE